MTADRCWNATVVAGSSWRLETSRRASRPSWTSSVPARNDWRGVGLARPARHELLEDGRRGAVAERDDGPRQQGAIGRAGAPADDDRPFEADAGRDVEDDALRPERPGQLREPVVGREACAAVEERADAIRGARGEVGDARQLDTRGGRLGRQGGRDEVALVDDEQAVGAGRQVGLDPRGPWRADERRRSRARRRAGRRTSCTAGSTRPGAPRTARTPPAGRRRASPPCRGSRRSRRGLSAAIGREKSVRPRRTGRARPGATVIRATPPSRA